MFFKFNNVSMEDLSVIPIEEDFLAKPGAKYEKLDDNNYIKYGYNQVNCEIPIIVRDKSKIPLINKVLNGKGILEFKDKICDAWILDEIKYTRTINLLEAVVNIIRSPYWYKKNDDFVKITSNVIINEGNEESEPIIKIENINPTVSKEVVIEINNNRFSLNTSTENILYIDTYNCVVFDVNNVVRNDLINDFVEFPKLQVGNNTTNINTLKDYNISIKRKDRWI